MPSDTELELLPGPLRGTGTGPEPLAGRRGGPRRGGAVAAVPGGIAASQAESVSATSRAVCGLA